MATRQRQGQPQQAAASKQGQQMQRRQEFDAMAPIGTAMNLKGLLSRQAGAFAQVLPKHLTPERLMKTALVAANRTPGLLQCTQASIIEVVTRAAELGLEISGTLGDAYAVPFNNKIKGPDGRDVWVNQATLIVGYRGLARLARQSGEIARIEANAVYENDTFEFVQGSEFCLRFSRCLDGERGKIRGYYAYAKLRDGGEQAEYMTKAEVESVRQQAKSKNSPAWKNHYDEMGKKTVFRRLCKWLPMSSDKWQKAVENDNADYAEVDWDTMMSGGVEEGDSKADGLASRLAGDDEANGQVIEVEAQEVATSGAPMLSEEQITEIRDACKREPALSFEAVQEVWGGPLESVTGDDGENNDALFKRVMKSVAEMKKLEAKEQKS